MAKFYIYEHKLCERPPPVTPTSEMYFNLKPILKLYAYLCLCSKPDKTILTAQA